MSSVLVFVSFSLPPSIVDRQQFTHLLCTSKHAAYTSFTYSSLSITSTASSGPASGDTIPGGRAGLWEAVATVTAVVKNTGGVQGAEVPQLYITLPSSAPSSPPKQLRGFAKLKLAPGESKTATFILRRRDLSYWDTGRQNWVVPSGSFGVVVGASSRDLRLNGKFDVY